MKKFFSIATLFSLLSAGVSWSQNASTSLLVSVEPKHGKVAPPLTAGDLTLTVHGKPAEVSNLVEFGQSPLQLLLLIDDSAGFSFGTELNTLKDFIRGLPVGVQIGIGYMRNGMVDYVQQFTADHETAASTIRLAAGRGGADVSPYDSLSYAIQHWPAGSDNPRREVILISSGIEGLGGGLPPENPYVNKSISDTQKAGVVVFGIYNPSVGHAGHTFWLANIGQSLLSQLCDASGGESYINTFGPPVDFGPFLRSIQDVLTHQYRLEFTLPAEVKPGLAPLKVKVREKDADIAVAGAVYVQR